MTTPHTNDAPLVFDLDGLNFAKGNGSITVVAQDARSGAVLMTAGADREAMERTIATREMHYTSRTRGLWHKGATSGNTQRVVSLHADCDGDAVLARIVPAGPACHTGATSCFGSGALAADELAALDATIAARAVAARDSADRESADARPSYTQKLLADRNLRLKKLGEEATELAVACADEDVQRATEETADLLYHALVSLRALGVGLDEVRTILAARAR